jgi:hypothetical protein
MLGTRAKFGGARPFDGDTLAWQSAVQGAGGAVGYAQLGFVDRLIFDLKAANAWAGLDRLWLFAAENTQQALIDLVARAAATAVNSPTFTAARGWQGNGTSSYLNSNFNAATAGDKFQLNDASHGVWVETYNSGASGGFEVVNDFSAYSFVRGNDGSGNMSWAVNNNGAVGAAAIANTGIQTGLFQAQRTGASALALFRNGASIATDSRTTGIVRNQNHGILANLGANFSAARLAAAFIGGSLTGKEAGFYNAMRTYMTSVGVP